MLGYMLRSTGCSTPTPPFLKNGRAHSAWLLVPWRGTERLVIPPPGNGHDRSRHPPERGLIPSREAVETGESKGSCLRMRFAGSENCSERPHN